MDKMDAFSIELLAEATRVRWPENPSDLSALFDDSPLVCHDTVRIVPLSEIQIKTVWAPERLNQIRRWGDRAKIVSRLTSASLFTNNNSPRDEISDRLVRLSRVGTGKYEISDGIHRINAARELGMPFILARVTDCEQWGEKELDTWRDSLDKDERRTN